MSPNYSSLLIQDKLIADSEEEKNNNYDMIIFCHLRWQFVYQRPQHLISRMSENFRILMVEEPIEFNDSNEFTAALSIINPNLHILQPRVRGIEDISKVVANYINSDTIKYAWFYSAAFLPAISNLKIDSIIYDCMDELSLFKGAPQSLIDQEKQLLEIANIVFTGGKSLFDAKVKLHNNVYCFPSSVDQNHFAQALSGIDIAEDIATISRPIVGYYGVIDERINLELIEQTARKLPNVSFVMIGPLAKIHDNDLPRLPNIHYLGMKTYEELPSYLKAFDIAMMPFALNESTRFISPTKTLEYMAAAKPIISTRILDVERDYKHCVDMIDDSDDFVKVIQDWQMNGSDKVGEFETILANTSWDATANKMQTIIKNYSNKKQGDILIIGAGISGSVLAERYAKSGKKVVILEKRDHIAGNCYDYIDENGILVSKYGAHLFHTNEEEVWEYINRFNNWYPWEHKVIARVDDKTVPIPVNITTVNILFGENISTEDEMKNWLDLHKEDISNPQNGEEAVLSKVGPILYEKMFKHYTKKQWDKYPGELDASVLNRIPVRYNYDDRYFSDKYQALPEGGYTKVFEKILDHPNIEVRLNTDYFDVKDEYAGFDKIFYTGPIDRFFEFKHSLNEKLEYRSINFVSETHNEEYFQENSVVNYPGIEVPYTRIVEYKHFGNQKSDKTTIVKEFTVDEGDPYYPVPNPRNQEIYSKYKEEADKLKDVYFVGRLANYKYFNMDQAFKNALDLFKELEPAFVEEESETTNELV